MRTTLSIPDEFYHQIDASYKERGYNTINDFILGCIRSTFPLSNIPSLQDNTLIPTPNPAQHQIDATKEIVETPELKPMCSMPFCKSRSEGHYRVTTDAGENTKDYNLCVFHWNKARRESEVREI